MSMKKFLVPALALVMLALTLTACGFVPASADTAYAAGNDYYICISPSDEELTASSASSPSDIVARTDTTGNVFFLQKSYYYKVSRYGSLYVMDGEFAALRFYIDGEVTDDMLVTSLPEGAAEASPLIPVTLAEGAAVRLTDGTYVTDADELFYIGAAAEGGSSIAFIAKNGASVKYGIADVSSFAPFTVSWHPVAEARRAELLAPEDPEPDVTDGDLTGGEPSDALRIILIIGIAVPALIIVFLLFKPVSGDKGYDKRKAMRRQEPERGGIDYDRARSYEADRDRYDRGYRDYERERPRDYDRDRDYGRDRDYDRGRDYDGRDRY